MLRRIIGVSAAHASLCFMAALWHQHAFAVIHSGDVSMALVAVCVCLAIVAGIRLQLAIMTVVIASCVRRIAPNLGRTLSRLAVWLAPSYFKKGIAVAVGLVIASASQATAAPMWPTSEPTPEVEATALATPSPIWPTNTVQPPAVKTPEPPARPSPTEKRTYTVREGDSLWKIAQRVHIDPDALFKANRTTIGKNPNVIFPGQELIVP